MSKTTDASQTTGNTGAIGVTPETSASGLPSPAASEPGGTAPAGGQPEAAPLLPRPMVAVASLTAHPGNVRRDLDLSDEFVASVAVNGVLVPLRITPAEDGTFRIIDGHRRLAAAIQAGLAEVPADLAGDRAADEAGQFLDMWTAHRHRKPLTRLEEADALFGAREAGATKAKIRKSTGLKPPEITAALAAARLSDGTRDAVQALPHDLTLEDLSVLAEFEDDPDALRQLLNTAHWHGALDHQAERLRQERADKADHARLRQELEAAGYSVTAALPSGGQPLTVLEHEGAELTPEAHAACPGRGVFFRSYDLTTPVHYCADPATHGHILPHANAVPAAGPAGAADTSRPVGAADRGPSDADRRLVVRGNKAWKAAALVRRRWLAGNLFQRRTAPREVAQFIARQLLTMPDPLRQGLATAHTRDLFTEITGQTADTNWKSCDTATAGRLPLLMLAPIVVAYEQAMTEGEGKNTWRPDRYSPCPRPEAGNYLAFVASVGYQLSDIEQAVADGRTYTGDTPASPLPSDAAEGEPADDGVNDEGTDGAPETSPDDGTGDADRSVRGGPGTIQTGAGQIAA
jgi:ParB family chromosome partitioning protein